jgi:hypothetical protein
MLKMLTKSLFSAALALTLSSAPAAFAKDTIKQARDNDIATQYGLTVDNTLYRIVGGKRCDITTDVQSFKVSQHPKDAAMLYYKKGSDLYVIGRSAPSRQCPKANSKLLMQDVKKYNVVSNTNTTIVNVALSYSGKFVAWDNSNPVLTVAGADDYEMNQNYGVQGKPFSSYVAFVHSAYGGNIMKVKGQSPEASKWDSSRYYGTIEDFKHVNKLESKDLE